MPPKKEKAPRRALGTAVRVREPELPLAGRAPMQITFDMLAKAAEKPNYRQNSAPAIDPFVPYEPMIGVLPKGHTAALAMDEIGASPFLGWAGGFTPGAAYLEGQTFLGYSELALMAQRPEYRLLCETLADEATRKGYKLKAKSEDDDKADKIEAIEDELKRLDIMGAFRKVAEQDGFFGRAHIYLDTGDTEDPQELATNLGDSFSTVSRGKVSPNRPLRALRTVEAMWSYPNFYSAVNPLKKDWYRPSKWFVMGQQVHASRLLTFVAREVPDILKPAYCFGGLALTQMCKPYVDNWLNTRQNVQDLIKGFSTWVLKTNMAAAYSGVGGDSFFKRADMFNLMRTNRGLMMIDKDTEEFANVSTSLSGLDRLQAQSQEHIASVSKMPLVKFTGISPSGLNASSEGELQCWGDYIKSYQRAMFDKPLVTIINFVQLSLWGEIDDGIIHEWLPLTELTEKEKAELDQLRAQTDGALVEMGAIDAHEVRQRIAMEEGGPYAGIDADVMPEPPGGEGMMPGMEGMEDPGDIAPPEGGEEAPGQPQIAAPAHAHAPALPKPRAVSAGGVGNPQEEGGFKPARAGSVHDAALDSPDKPERKRGRSRKFVADPPEGSVEANAGERL